MLANLGLGIYDAAKTGNWGSFVGSTVGSFVGGAVFGSLGQQMAGGLAKAMGETAWGFAGGALMGAVEFGMAGFGAGFGGALGGGASLKESFKAGGLSAAVSGGIGASIQGSYMAGWQGSLHGMSYEQVATVQGNAALQAGRPQDLAGIDSAVRSRTRGALGLYLHGTNAEGAAGISITRRLKDWSWVTVPHAIDAMTGKPAIMLNPAQYRAFTGIPSYDKGEFFALIVAPSTSVHWRGLSEGAAPQAQIYGEHEVLPGSPYRNPNR